MGTYRVILSAQAAQDVRDIGDFIRDDSPEYADEISKSIIAEVKSLTDMPGRTQQIGRSRKTVFPIHRSIMNPFIIYYRLEPQIVFILMVRHGKQRQPKRFE